MTLASLLAETVAQLERAKVPYMLTGSIASSFYGEPRATRDLDVVIDPDRAELSSLLDELQGAGLDVDREVALAALDDRTQFNAVDGSTGWKIDFVIRKDRPFSEAEFSRRERAMLLGISTWIATIEDTIVAKLEWAAATGSDQQRRDVTAMVEIAGQTIDRAYVERWVVALGLQSIWRRTEAGGVDETGP